MRLATLAYALMCICIATAAAHAEKRVALVIGNTAYRSVPELPNARGDATAIAKLLSDAKFDVVEPRSDLGVDAFRRALREFAVTSAVADIALVYFAGHGIELAGANYLIPVDAKLANDLDVEDETISLERVLRTIEPARRLRLVILDACRENPFAPRMASLSPTRSVSRGLGRVELDSSNTMVAFAAKAGSIAEDGQGGNSPFTRALLANLTTPGLDVRIALGRARDQVVKDTNRRQEPFVYGSLGGDTVSLVPSATQLASLPPVHKDETAAPKGQPEGSMRNVVTDVGSLRSVHGDWQVRCSLAGTPPRDQCAVVQSVTAAGKPYGLTVLMLRSTENKILMRVIAPEGTLLPSGLGLKIDDKDIGRAGFVKCLSSSGCIAEVTADDTLMKSLRTGKTATFIIFQVPDEGIGFPLSLTGFAAAMAALP